MAKDVEEKIEYSGKTFEIVNRLIKAKGKTLEVEIARRSPGVRLIIVKGNNILLTKEYRYELQAYDYRLPGGKVFDSLEEYKSAAKGKSTILKHAILAAKKECREETGLIAKQIKHFQTSKAGLTIDWDLLYFVIDKFENNKKGQELEHVEIIHPEWKTFDEAKELCLNGKMHEDRSAGILLKFLFNSKNFS